MAQSPFLSLEEVRADLRPWTQVCGSVATLPGDQKGQIRARYVASSLHAFATWAFEALKPGVSFADNWHIAYLCQELEDFAFGLGRTTLINLPPRSLKSFLCAIVLPAWWQLFRPALKFTVVTYGDTLSREHMEQFQDLVSRRSYLKMQRACLAGNPLAPKPRPHRVTGRTTLSRNAFGGTYETTTIRGAFTGKGTQVLIIDDPIKAEEGYSDTERDKVNRWFESTARSRFDNPQEAAVLVVMQRLHEQDLSASLKAKGQVRQVILPARFARPQQINIRGTLLCAQKSVSIAPNDLLHAARLPRAHLDELEQAMPPEIFNAQYLQDPTPASGNIFKIDQFRSFEAGEVLSGDPSRRDYPLYLQKSTPQQRKLSTSCRDHQCRHVEVLSIDTAMTVTKGADYSVISHWTVMRHKCALGNKLSDSYTLRRLIRGRFEIQDLVAHTLNASQAFDCHILIEGAANGQALAQLLKPQMAQSQRALSCPGIQIINPTQSKKERALIAASKVKAGQVYLPNIGAWQEPFYAEVAAFPNGKHDDIVDTMTQILTFDPERLFPPQKPRRVPAYSRNMRLANT